MLLNHQPICRYTQRPPSGRRPVAPNLSYHYLEMLCDYRLQKRYDFNRDDNYEQTASFHSQHHFRSRPLPPLIVVCW